MHIAIPAEHLVGFVNTDVVLVIGANDVVNPAL